MFLLRLAYLNVRRNPRRTIISVTAVSVGLASLIFLWAFIDGYQEQQRENAIQLFFGHTQIVPKGFREKLSPESTIADRSKTLDAVREAEGFVSATERIHAEVLIGTSENSRGVVLFGIDPETEPSVTEIAKNISVGEALQPNGNRSILVGEGVAERLSVKLGDKVVLMTQALDGTLSGYSYKIVGLISTGTAIDDVYVMTTKTAAQELLGIGDDVQEIVVRLTDRSAIPKFIQHVSTKLESGQYEIVPWYDIIPEIEQWSGFSGAVVRTMLAIIVFVIGMGLMNIVLISIFERMKELGVMLAIGTSPRQMVGLIVLETLTIELIGVLLGLALGYAASSYFYYAGIRLEGFEQAARQAFMSPVIYPVFQLSRALESAGILVLMTSFVGLYPAWKAARLEPVKAIYHG